MTALTLNTQILVNIYSIDKYALLRHDPLVVVFSLKWRPACMLTL